MNLLFHGHSELYKAATFHRTNDVFLSQQISISINISQILVKGQVNAWVFVPTSHYGRQRLCLAPGYLPSAIHRALGKDHLCLAPGPRQRLCSAKISLSRAVRQAKNIFPKCVLCRGPCVRRSAKARSRQRTSFPSAKRSAKARTWQRDNTYNMGYLLSPFAERPPLGARQRHLFA